MADVLKGKHALEQYTEERLAAAPVQRIVSTAQPQAATADDIVRLRDRMVGAVATSAERELEHRQTLADVRAESELLEAEEELDDKKDQKAERLEDRRQRQKERREDGQASVLGMFKEMLGGGGVAGERMAAVEARLLEMTEDRRDAEITGAIDELRAQGEELRGEIRAATAANGASSSLDLGEEFERLANLRDRARTLFGDGGIPTQTAMDLRVLEIQHRQAVQLREMDNRQSLEERRLRLDEERLDREQVDRDQRAGQLDALLQAVAPAIERAVDQFGGSAGSGASPAAAAAPQIVAAPPAGPATGNGATPAPPTPLHPQPPVTVLPQGVAALPCSNPECGQRLLVYEGQNYAVCQSCGMVSTTGPPEQPPPAEEPGPTRTPTA